MQSIFVVVGGLWLDWIKAHIRRFIGVNLFGSRRELFWVRFPESTGYLKTLKRYCEEGKLKVVLIFLLLRASAASETQLQPYQKKNPRHHYPQSKHYITTGSWLGM